MIRQHNISLEQTPSRRWYTCEGATRFSRYVADLKIRIFPQIIIFILISFLLKIDVLATDPGTVFNQFLKSHDLKEQRYAYNRIIDNPSIYINIIKDKLGSLDPLNESPNNIDKLFYVSAYIKSPDLVKPLADLFLDENFLPDYCIYECPIVFVMTLYSVSGLWTPPENLDLKVDKFNDLLTAVKYASSVELTKKDLQINGLGIDKEIDQTLKLTINQLLDAAGPENNNTRMRFAAVYRLGSTITTSEHLPELYWLAIQEIADASREYRGSIYKAIYRAEKAKRLGDRN